MLNLSSPGLSDYYLIQGECPKNLKTGNFYSYYTAPASLLPLPLMVISRAVNGAKVASDRFSFSILSAFAGACIGPLLLAFYFRLRIPLKKALAWTFVFAVGTLWWPCSETVFDQCQHGVALLAITLTAYDAAKGGRLGSAFVTGLLGGLLYNYRVPFAALLPVFPIYWILEARRTSNGAAMTKRTVGWQTVVFAVGVGIGLAGYAYYNFIRFGQVNMPPIDSGVPMTANPIFGFLTLIVSPGKGVFWFSPPLILAAFGISSLIKADLGLGRLVVILSILHVGEMSCVSFAGGDWCWGPRYLLAIMPLWALAFPFIPAQAVKRWIVYSLVAAGVIVQLMAVSIENHRFFYYNRMRPHFWLDKWAYFRISQLLSRPAEILESIEQRDRYRPKVNSSPSGEATYCPFGPPGHVDASERPKPKLLPTSHGKSPLEMLASGAGAKRLLGRTAKPPAKRLAPPDPRTWQEQFRMFYLPRPWWGWINHVPVDQRPVNPLGFLAVCCITTGLGAGMLGFAVRGQSGADEPPPEDDASPEEMAS